MTSRAACEASCLIVAALAGESQHGCGIVAAVSDMSGGRVQLRVGMLFTVLDALLASGLVRIERDEIVRGRLRRYYRLSSPSRSPVGPAGLAAWPDLRISDADRDAAAAALSEYFAQGRLTADELRGRLDLALSAVTRRDIWAATQDLPWQYAWPEGGGGGGAPDHSARQDAEAP
jgi:PadR family transcriptional regulator, regulatory protein PadR